MIKYIYHIISFLITSSHHSPCYVNFAKEGTMVLVPLEQIASKRQSCPFKSPHCIDKLERGSYDAVTGTLDDTKIKVTRWKDNAVVTVASTLLGESPVGNANRWSKKDCKRIQVTIPHVIDIYNQNMGGPDCMDQNINAYKTWLIYASVQNAWLLARSTGKDIEQLEFRRSCYVISSAL